MATGKERGYERWRLSKSFKRSARNFTEHDEIRRGSRKNTKKWCRGTPGKKHIFPLFNKWTGEHGYRCLVCRKQFYFPVNRADFDFVPMSWEEYR